MTREELKAHCKKQIEMCEMWAKAKGENPCGKVYEEHKMILELLDQKTRWIPVSEGLPEDHQRVLVTVVRYSGDKITRLAEYYSRNNGKGIFQIQENHEEWEVGEKGLLAWMPLPEPYKEVSE